MKTSLRIIFLSLFIAFISASPAFSATWNGGGADNLASTSANWTGSVVPPTGDSILFNNTSSKDCTWDISDVNKTFTVIAIDGGYTGAVTIDATGILTISGTYVPPAAPTGLNATAFSSSRIDLTWTDNATTETGYKIERRTETGTYSQIGTAGVNANSYSDTDPSLTFVTTYYYQVRAYDVFSDSSYSNEAHATTFAIAPTATTNAASNNAGTTATLNGTVNPDGADTTVSFEWGPSTAYGNTATVPAVPAGLTDVAVSANISGLTPNTPYHYKVKAVNSIGTTYGLDSSFTTPVIAPSATTNAATNNTSNTPNSATLNGSINPNGAATSVYFQWGTNTDYGNTTTTQNILAGVNNVAVTANITGLTVGTTYHYRVVATNSAGTTYGNDMPFVTPTNAPPHATTNSATNKNGNSATLNATVNPNGLLTSVHFEWGLTNAYGSTVTLSLLPAGINDVPLTANITGLTPTLTYHYRIVTENSAGPTVYGADMTFTTPPITITITSPVNGSTIYRPDTMVKGSFTTTTGNETGMTVNGIVGMVYNNQFAVNHVPLSNGANTISVTATDTAGNTATTAITVTAVIPYPYVKLTANTEAGVSPLPVNFTASTTIPNAVTTYKIDYDGNGTDDYTGSTFTNISHTYSSPGIYYAKLTVVDSASTSYTDTIGLAVLDSTNLDGLLRAKWTAMTTAIGNGDVATALTHISGSSAAAYQQMFNAIGNAQLQSINSTQTGLSLVSINNGTAIYKLHTLENGKTRAYEVVFEVDQNGIWMIKEY